MAEEAVDASARSHPDVPTWGIDSTFGDVRCSVEPLTPNFGHLAYGRAVPKGTQKFFDAKREVVKLLLLLGGFERFFH